MHLIADVINHLQNYTQRSIHVEVDAFLWLCNHHIIAEMVMLLYICACVFLRVCVCFVFHRGKHLHLLWSLTVFSRTSRRSQDTPPWSTPGTTPS